MNGGASSTLPRRNPSTVPRPVSFHSLSEHNRNNPAFLSPYSHRKSRIPRSSPLAGPSLSSEEVDNEKKDDEGSRKPKYRPNRISSTPDMEPPIHSVYGSDVTSSQSNGSVGIALSPPPVPPSSSSSSSEDGKDKEEETEDGNRPRTFAKRVSIISTSSLTTNETDKENHKRRSILHSASTSTTSLASTSSGRTARTDKGSQPAPPTPNIPRWALNAMREEAGIANRNMKYGHRRGTSDDITGSSSLPPLPNQPIPRGTPLSASSLSNKPRPPSISRDPGENWMSVTDPIPKFSRLGLGGDVVMPMKKKESLAKMKSSTSIKSTDTISQTPASGARRDSESAARNESIPATDSNDSQDVIVTDANLKEEGRRRRRSLVVSLKSKIPRINGTSSAVSENVPPVPSFVTQPVSIPPPVSDSRTSASRFSNDSASKPPEPVAFPPVAATATVRRSTTSRRDSVLAVIEENHFPLPPPNDTEIGRMTTDVKSQDTQKTRARRKSIKQIVMRITTAPISVGEKLKLGAIHDQPSAPVVVLPADGLMPIDPPPAAWFRSPASSSVPSLPSTKETSELRCGQSDVRGSKRFKGLRKRWNAVLATVRG